MTDGFIQDSPFKTRMTEGRELPIAVCTCPACQLEFYVADIGGTEWHPRFCCYCGQQFKRAHVIDVAIVPVEPPDPECQGK